jgi:hypothetical protein
MPRTLTFADEKVRFGNAEKGTAEFKTKDGNATFTAHMKNGKVAKIAAKGQNGQPAKVYWLREIAADEEGSGSGSGSGDPPPTGPVKCSVCIEVPGGASWCYPVDCGNIPGPSKEA